MKKFLIILIILFSVLFGQAEDFILKSVGHPDSTYKQLLRFGNNAASQDTLKQIFDGTGDSTALFLAHDSVKVQGALEVTGVLTVGSISGESDPFFLADVRDSVNSIIDTSNIGYLPQDESVTGTWNFNSIQINPTASQSYVEGLIYYDSDDNTLVVYSDEPDAAMNVGEENWKAARNITGATILDGTPVYITGATGQIATADSTDADVAATAKFVGLFTHDIENNTNGKITTFGITRGLDTDGSPYGESWSDGDEIYISQTKGWLTNVRPSTAFVTSIGHVDYAHTTLGRIQVHPVRDWAIDFRAGNLFVTDSTFADTLEFNIMYGGTIKTGLWNGTSIADAYIDDNITVTGYQQDSDTTAFDLTKTQAIASYQPLDGTLTAFAGLTIGTNELIYGTGADAFSMLGVNATATNKFLRQISSGVPAWATLVAGDIPDISGTYQPLDGALTSISGLVYVSPSFIKLTADDTYAVRTLTETKTDLSLDNVTNVATSDVAYNATSWNTNLDNATKNSIRDKVETIDTAIGLNTTHRGSDGSDHSFIDQNVISGSSPTFDSANITGVGGQFTLARIAGSTFSSVQHLQDIFHSAGWVSGGGITDDADGTITVAAGTGLIRATNSSVAQILYFDWAQEAGVNVNLVDNDINYIYVEYNSGSPQVVARITESTDFHTDVLLAVLSREGTTIHINETDKHQIGDHANSMIRRMKGAQPYGHVSGGILSAPSGVKIELTTGTFWRGLTEFNTSAINTNVASTFSYYYKPAGAWTKVSTQTDIDNLQYNDFGTGLANLSNNKYGVHWVYLEADDDDVAVVYGVGDYTLSEAEDAQAPSSVPLVLEVEGILAGKIIIKEGVSSFTQIESAFQTTFQGAVATDHGGLAGLGDDDHTQYILADGTRAFTGSQAFGGFNLTNIGNITTDGTIDQTIANTGAGGDRGINLSITHDTNPLTGIAVAVRGNTRIDIDSPAGTAMGAEFKVGNTSTGYDISVVRGVYSELVNKIPSGATTWDYARGFEANMDLDQGSAGNVNTITNASMFYGNYNLPTVGTYATVTNGYGLKLRNQAVGGTGQMLDAGFYLDDLSMSGGVKGWDFGIDFSGIGSNSGGFGTADIKGALGEIWENTSTDGFWTTDGGITATGTISVNDAAGGAILDEAATSTNPTIIPNKADLDTGIGKAGADILVMIAGAIEAMRYTEAASAIEALLTGNLTVVGNATVGNMTIGNLFWDTLVDDTISDASAHVIYTYDASAAEMIFALEATIVGRRSNTDTANSYKITGSFKNNGGTVTQIGATTVVYALEEAAIDDPIFNINGTDVEVSVDGLGAYAQRWTTYLQKTSR